MKEKWLHSISPSYRSFQNSVISKSTSKKPYATSSYVDCEARWFRGDCWRKKTSFLIRMARGAPESATIPLEPEVNGMYMALPMAVLQCRSWISQEVWEKNLWQTQIDEEVWYPTQDLTSFPGSRFVGRAWERGYWRPIVVRNYRCWDSCKSQWDIMTKSSSCHC